MVADFIEASQVGDADLSHELHFQLLPVAAQFCGLNVSFLLELLLVANRVLQIVQLVRCGFDVLHIRNLPEQVLIVQLLDLLIVGDVGLMRLDAADRLRNAI